MKRAQWRTLSVVVVAAMLSTLFGLGYRYFVSESAAGAHRVQAVSAAPPSGVAMVWFEMPEKTGRVDMVGIPQKTLSGIGSDRSALISAFPAWKIKAHATGRVVLTPTGHGNALTIGSKDGFVTLFIGKPSLGVVYQITGIPMQGLLPQDKARVESGIGVSDPGAAWQLLEGLAG